MNFKRLQGMLIKISKSLKGCEKSLLDFMRYQRILKDVIRFQEISIKIAKNFKRFKKVLMGFPDCPSIQNNFRNLFNEIYFYECDNEFPKSNIKLENFFFIFLWHIYSYLKGDIPFLIYFLD